MTNNDQRSKTEETILDQTLTFRLKGLTDREFSVFLAIYEIERELGEVTFTDLANKLNLSEPAIRNIVNRVLSKQMPIKKDRFFNRKVILSIKQEFRDQKIIRAILKLRQISTTQTTLFGL
jgi:DNA-directed RNA polymerase sigma subunit (sigma70/sigma32)